MGRVQVLGNPESPAAYFFWGDLHMKIISLVVIAMALTYQYGPNRRHRSLVSIPFPTVENESSSFWALDMSYGKPAVFDSLPEDLSWCRGPWPSWMCGVQRSWGSGGGLDAGRVLGPAKRLEKVDANNCDAMFY